jgi:hypothetical protein
MAPTHEEQMTILRNWSSLVSGHADSSPLVEGELARRMVIMTGVVQRTSTPDELTRNKPSTLTWLDR